MAAGKWKVTLRPQADRQLDELTDRQRAECLDVLEDMEEGYFLDTVTLRGHRAFERAKFYSRGYRIVYRINRRDRHIRITRIGKRDETIYKGFNPET